MQRLKSDDMQSQQRHLSFLSLFQHSVHVFLSVRSAEAGDNIRRHAALIWEWIRRENGMQTLPLNIKKKREQNNGCSKGPPVSDVVAKRVKGGGLLVMEYYHHKFPFIQTTKKN
ncbi:hypothetical protein E3U43_005837 [Larimichthys crocea]|uniref:Uncharacterized protein n=1 Tax=Larimichthys crocea TaxID=215358 RepID=A0ACD3QMM9_LARCR|nr:hypothetical protein E3U43_005837 [Larimichthys crocea]